MDLNLLFSYLPVVWRELFRHKFLVLACFAVVSGAILFIGMGWQVKYQTETTIYADNQNILKPLLAQSAEVTRVQDRTRVVQDVIHSPRILRKVVEKLYSIDDFESAAALEQKINSIRNRLRVAGLGSSYIKISYSDVKADDSYNILNAVTDLFIKDSSESKRAESKEAFLFIDRQVKQYKKQLVDAEHSLKEFRSNNFDGRDTDVDGRIARLRADIESMKIEIAEAQTRMSSLTQQLKEESQYSARKYKADIYRERLQELQSRLDSMLLVYKESYPDVVSTRIQIEDIKQSIRDAETEQVPTNGGRGDADLNPLYEELRSGLAAAKVDLRTRQHRLKANEQLLEEEFSRRKRIASRQAELAELTRDYNVTKDIYEDMLERKEKARLSMTLNVEGQGITYKVQQPAEYPLVPVGMRFLHFVVMGLLAGAIVPIVLAIAYVVIDPRIRFVKDLEKVSPVPVLVDIPHLQTPLAKRISKGDMTWFLVAAGLIMVAYITVAFMHRQGII